MLKGTLISENANKCIGEVNMPEQLRCEACGINFETKEAMQEHGKKSHAV